MNALNFFIHNFDKDGLKVAWPDNYRTVD